MRKDPYWSRNFFVIHNFLQAKGKKKSISDKIFLTHLNEIKSHYSSQLLCCPSTTTTHMQIIIRNGG